MTSQLIVRIEQNLKEQVSKCAKNEGKSISEVIRELLENYVQDRDISSYIDNLWSRIGGKLKDHGESLDSVDTVIRRVRSEK
ncbi:MAG TPA: ribbon-helix-helix domain-containing protein [bacterium]|nr:ribbon-helix-helix domain-containing protein [bacterium]